MQKDYKGAKSPSLVPGCLLVPVLFIAALLSIPFSVVAVIYLGFRETRLFRRLEAQHRVLPWRQVEKHLAAGEGTLIVEQANKLGGRFWWTPDDIKSKTQAPFLNYNDFGNDYILGKSSQPFVHWCYENYLSLNGGKAYLGRSKELQLPPGPIDTNFLKSLYPNAKIVHTLRIKESR